MGRLRGSTRNRFRLFSSVFSGFLVPLFCLAVSSVDAQQTVPAQTPDSNSQIPEVRTTPSVGNLPSSALDPSSLIRQNLPGAARISAAPAQLSLQDAIRLALANNLATLSAQEQRRAALGFQPGTFPGFNTSFIGPFNNFDARARLVQNIFDLSAIRNYQSSKQGIRIAD